MPDIAVATARGGRDHMEDFVHVEQAFGSRSRATYVAVFDGHGGDEVARRASKELHGLVAAEWGLGGSLAIALPAAFRAFDTTVAGATSGSTAVVAVLDGPRLTIANAGDSHAILVSPAEVSLLTTDHRLTNEEEHRRVLAAGAVIRGPYACLPDGSGLMCTRSLGDREFRQIGILAEPAVAEMELGPDDEWVVLGSDGVWDGLAPEDVGELVRGATTAKRAVETVRDRALKANTDNVSVVVVRLDAG